MLKKISILLLEENGALLDSLMSNLDPSDFDIHIEKNSSDGIEAAYSHMPHLIL